MEKEIYDLTKNLREKAETYNEEMAVFLGCKPDESLAGLFGMIFNSLTVNMELIYYYFKVWQVASSTLIEKDKEDNRIRIILIQKMTFILILSHIEFKLKKYVKDLPQKIGDCKDQRGRVYLYNIMKNSENKGVITSQEFVLWQGVINLRNSLVHNNGVPEETKNYTYPDCELILENGQEIVGNLKLFPHLTNWLIDASKDWINNIHRK